MPSPRIEGFHLPEDVDITEDAMRVEVPLKEALWHLPCSNTRERWDALEALAKAKNSDPQHVKCYWYTSCQDNWRRLCGREGFEIEIDGTVIAKWYVVMN